MLGATVGNSASPGSSNLNYTLTVAMQSGSGTLGTVTPASGSLAPSASQSCTVPASSTTLGVTTISYTASDPNSSNLSQATTASLTVLDHAAAAFANGSTTLNLNFGDVELGSGTQALPFQIENLFATYRAGLVLNSVTTISDPLGLFSTNAADFADLARHVERRLRRGPFHFANRPVLRPVPVQPVGRDGPQWPRQGANPDAQRDSGCRAGTLHPRPARHGTLGLLAYAWRRRRATNPRKNAVH